MKILFICFVAMTLLQGAVFAKRMASAEVVVFHNGIRFSAPNDDGRRAYIEAKEVQTGRKLWELTNQIDPELEEDVQWVYIKTLRIREGTLIVTSERGKVYRIDL